MMAHREVQKPFSQVEKTGKILDFDLQSGTSKTSPVMSCSENSGSVTASMNGSIIDYLPSRRQVSNGLGETTDTFAGSTSGFGSLPFDANLMKIPLVHNEETNCSVPSENAGHLSNRLLASQMDELEQRQAQEQSRLLQKFKELRQWQSQQQGLLMLQQQQQLEVLRSEQLKFQSVMTKQRNNQWGATAHAVNGNGASSPTRTPRKNRPGGGVAQTLANSLLAKSELTKTLLPQQIAALVENSSFYPDPNQGNQFIAMDMETDSNFSYDSQSNIDSATGFEGEIRRLPDDEPIYRNDMNAGRLPFSNATEHPKLAPSLVNKLQRSNARNIDLETDEGIGTQSLGSFAPVPDNLDPAEKQNSKVLQNSYPEYGEHVTGNHLCDDEDDDDDYYEEEVDNVYIEKVQHDDIPINPGIAGKKTFEQLLEEQLKAEEAKLQAPADDSPTVEKKTFLKKGQGITARFFSKPKQPSSRKKSKTSGVPNSPPHTTKSVQSSRPSKIEVKSKTGSKSPRQTQQTMPVKTKSSPSRETTTNKQSKVPSKTSVQKIQPSVTTSLKLGPDNAPKKLESNKQVQPTVPKSLKHVPESASKHDKKVELNKPEKKTVESSLKTNQKLTDKLKMIKEYKISDSDSLPDDASFVQNIKEREKNAEEEIDELKQFELLEEMADNMSLCSTSSVVRRVLNNEKITSNKMKKPSSSLPDSNQILNSGLQMKQLQQTLQQQQPQQRYHQQQQQQEQQQQHQKLQEQQHQQQQAHLQMLQKQQSQQREPVMPSVANSTATTSVKSDWSSIKIRTSYSDSDSWEDADSDDADTSVNSESGGNEKSKNDKYQTARSSAVSGVSSEVTLTASDTKTDSYSSISNTLKSKQSPRKENEMDTFREFITHCGDGDSKAMSDIQAIPKSPSKVITRKVAVCDSRVHDVSLPNSQGDAQITSVPKNPAILLSQDAFSSKSDSTVSSKHKQKYFIKRKGVDNLETIDVSDSYSQSDSNDSDSCVDKLRTEASDVKRKEDCLSSDSDKFDDEDEWGSETVLKKFTRQTKEEELDNTLTPKSEQDVLSKSKHVEDKSEATPPTSRLMTQLFPKLKQQPSKAAQQTIQTKETLQAVTQQSTVDGIQSKVLRTKLSELEKEIERFRDENAALEKMRRERDEGIAKLKKEIADFEKEKTNELKRLQEFKAEEMKKIKHERKMFEKYQKTIRSMPDKKDREEIEMLKDQLTELQEEMKRKEARWSSSTSRLKDRLEHLEEENRELKEEIKVMEKKRLEWLQKEQNAKKSNQPRLTPRSNSPTNPDMLTQSLPANFPSKNKPNDHFATQQQMVQPSNADINHEDAHKKKTVSKSRVSSGFSKVPEKKKPNQRLSTEKAKPSSHTLQKPPQTVATSKAADVTTKSQGQILRASLAEDVPRKSLTNEVLPQDVSMYSEPDLDGQTHESQQMPRKFASKFNVDRSMIDKDAEYEENRHSDGKVERVYRTGAREILFANGTRKEISSDGQSIVVSFFNGDIKQIMADQRVIYYYSETQTTHTTYQDGLEILQFANNQTEKHYPDGTKEITFSDQTIKYLFPNGSEESIFPDGTVIRINTKGEKTMEFPNGQREIHTDQFKKREYPDGTVKTVYPDGRQETTYSNGRIRIKDKDGNVIVDRTC